MRVLLEVAEFTPADLPLVAGFSCGAQPWEIAMAEWIKAPPTALFGNSSHETSVWLYFHPDGRVVGFGSLGTARWTSPYPDGPWMDLSIIPALAIQTEFQHLSRGVSEDDNPNFSHQILGDLLGRALLQPPDFIVLCVHRDNDKAIRLYQRFGFKDIPGPTSPYKRMQRRLR
jgi:ribosomal protein S18 acetylase RimI-like enzyme